MLAYGRLRDALNNALVEAAGSATVALERIIREPVSVKTLNVHLLGVDKKPSLVTALPGRLMAISQNLKTCEGDVGKASLALPLDHVSALAALSVGWMGQVSATPNGVDIDVLKEISNILLGRFVESTGHAIDQRFNPSIPTIVEGPARLISGYLMPVPTALRLEAHLSASAKAIELLLLIALTKTPALTPLE